MLGKAGTEGSRESKKSDDEGGKFTPAENDLKEDPVEKSKSEKMDSASDRIYDREKERSRGSNRDRDRERDGRGRDSDRESRGRDSDREREWERERDRERERERRHRHHGHQRSRDKSSGTLFGQRTSIHL